MFFNYTLETSPETQDIKETEIINTSGEDLASKAISQIENPGNLKSNALVCPRCDSYIEL